MIIECEITPDIILSVDIRDKSAYLKFSEYTRPMRLYTVFTSHKRGIHLDYNREGNVLIGVELVFAERQDFPDTLPIINADDRERYVKAVAEINKKKKEIFASS